MQTVTNKELEEMAQDLYKRLGGVGQKDARIVRALLARITELETKIKKATEQLENVSNIPVYGWGEEACAAYAGGCCAALEILKG
jgi:hypothetical protein